jgi:SAM-dependent methyltransferase
MIDAITPQQFWEQKILTWERARYSRWLALYPLSWSVRSRLRRARGILLKRAAKNCSLLELGCGSGRLAEKLQNHVSRYRGIDLAANAVAQARARVPQLSFTAGDIYAHDLSGFDVTVFLGLTDWVDDLPALFARLRSPKILFSYTQGRHSRPYHMYRRLMDNPRPCLHARMYTEREIREALAHCGYEMERLTRPSIMNPGVLVWAHRHA